MASHDVPDLVTLGETMAVFICEDEPDLYRLTAAGAESNVAVGMAQLGLQTHWLSRLGEDQLGRFVHDWIASHGVAVHVGWDPVRETATCIKEVRPHDSRMRYYRSSSAARHLDLLDLWPLATAPRIHLTGVTPALSTENRTLVEGILRRRPGPGRISFDVNYRAQLWPDAAAAAGVLLPLARLADVIFIGEDEALALVGSEKPEVLAEALLHRPDQELVLKRGGGTASLLNLDGEVSEPAQEVAIVDLTGAGDAFAAGYLSASVWGWDAHGRLRLGHFLAARAVGEVGDVGPTPGPEELAQVASSVGQTLPHTIRDSCR